MITRDQSGDPEHAPRRVLVTGGAGFIGSHLADLLLARGDHVTVIDNLSTGSRDNLPPAQGCFRFIEADLKEALHAMGRGEVFDEVYHMAAAVGVALVMRDPIGSIETNIDQTSAVLAFAGRCGPSGRPASVLIASSSEVYGKGVREPFAEDDDILLGPTRVTRWSYAHSKAIDEHLALAHHATTGLPAVVVRFFNTVGPRQVGRYGMVLPRFVRAALDGAALEIHGDGLQSRCFCDARDAVRALPRLLAEPAALGRVFNLGSDQPITIGALADLVLRVTGSCSEKRFIPYERAYPAGFEDLRARRPDLTRIRAVVGFRATIALERTIADLAAGMRSLPRPGPEVRVPIASASTEARP
jgi:UDP-glucose 4-epimerase